MATGLMLKKLVLKNLLSFGPEGVELELGPLNVLIGPNASGKSNLIDAVRLLAACESDVSEPIVKGGGLESWLYKGVNQSSYFEVEALSENLRLSADDFDPFIDAPFMHTLTIDRSYQQKVEIKREQILTNVGDVTHEAVFNRSEKTEDVFSSAKGKIERRARELGNSESILKRVFDERLTLSPLAYFYSGITIYSDWNTSRTSLIRLPQPADADGTRLNTEGTNLALVLNLLDNKPLVSKRIISELMRFAPRAKSIKTPVLFGQIGGYLEEEGLSENIPFARLSDGTLRWLCLLAVLLHPEPPSLVCLEEPEVGLHPDMLGRLAELLIEASERTQLIVTTHSDLLVSALSNRPESIVVCEHDGASTRFHRPNPEHLQEYIANYQLGEAWLKGEIGGTRY